MLITCNLVVGCSPASSAVVMERSGGVLCSAARRQSMGVVEDVVAKT